MLSANSWPRDTSSTIQIGSSQVLWESRFLLAGLSGAGAACAAFLAASADLLEPTGEWAVACPLVGKNVRLGVLGGVIGIAVFQLKVLAPTWFGLTPQPFIGSHPLTLEGPFPLVGLLLSRIISWLSYGLFPLLLLFLGRLILRRAALALGAFIAVWTVMTTLIADAHPVIGWFAHAPIDSLHAVLQGAGLSRTGRPCPPGRQRVFNMCFRFGSSQESSAPSPNKSPGQSARAVDSKSVAVLPFVNMSSDKEMNI